MFTLVVECVNDLRNGDDTEMIDIKLVGVSHIDFAELTLLTEELVVFLLNDLGGFAFDDSSLVNHCFRYIPVSRRTPREERAEYVRNLDFLPERRVCVRVLPRSRRDGKAGIEIAVVRLASNRCSRTCARARIKVDLATLIVRNGSRIGVTREGWTLLSVLI